MWRELTQYPKLFAGVSSTGVFLPSGSKIIHLMFVGGTCTLPDGYGSTVTIQGVASQWFVWRPMHLNKVLQSPTVNGPQVAVVFSGTSAYFMEVLPPGGSGF